MKFNLNIITAVSLGILYYIKIFYFINSGNFRSLILVTVFVACICFTNPWQRYKRLVRRPTNVDAGLFVTGLVCWLLLLLLIVLAFIDFAP